MDWRPFQKGGALPTLRSGLNRLVATRLNVLPRVIARPSPGPDSEPRRVAAVLRRLMLLVIVGSESTNLGERRTPLLGAGSREGQAQDSVSPSQQSKSSKRTFERWVFLCCHIHSLDLI